MNQTKIGYYADLFFYPTVVGGLLLYDLNGRSFALHSRWWFALVCGAILWTLVEYLLHRFVYHKVAVIRELHGMHHSRPNDFIGAPIWVSIASFSSFLFFSRCLGYRDCLRNNRRPDCRICIVSLDSRCRAPLAT